MKRIGIYGGTFAPIHVGHVKAARDFYDALSLHELLIMPTFISPHKSLRSDDDPRLRLEMARLAFENDGRNISVSDYEISKGGKSYTYLTLEHFSSPDVKLYFLMGTDMLLSLGSWRHPEKILSLCTVCHVFREEKDEKVKDAVREAKERYKREYGAEIIEIESEPFEVSSSEIRAKCAENRDITALVPHKVKDYINRNRLYRSSPLYATVRENVKEKRWAHIFGTEEAALDLSRIFELDDKDSERLRTAALLHDLTKYYSASEHLSYLESIGVTPDEYTVRSEKTYHQLSGAYKARELHPDLVDGAVFNAIRYHTTGKADMSLLEKLMYLSDYIEPNRTFPDCVTLREMFYSKIIDSKNKEKTLNEIMAVSFDMTVNDLVSNGHPVHPDTEAGREYIKKLLNEG